MEPPKKLFNRNYVLQWQGQFLANLGFQAFTIAMLFWIKHATGSATLMGILQMLSNLPGVLLGPIGGVLADRYSRRKIIIISHLSRSIAAVALSALIFLQPDATKLVLVALFSVAIFNATVNAFFGPAISATIPDLVPKERVASANSLGQLTMQISVFLGQGLGGVLFRLLGAAMLFLFDGLAYLYASVSQCFVYIPQAIKEKKGSGQSRLRMFKEDIIEGLHYARVQPGLKEVVLVSAFMSFFTAPIIVLLPFYVEDVLRAQIDWYGFLAAGSGVGTLLGYIFVGAIRTSAKSRGMTVLIFILLNAIGYGILGLIRVPIYALILAIAGGFTSGYITVSIMTILQVSTPGEIRGRILGLLSAISASLTPIGMGMAGIVADAMQQNIPAIYVACSASMVMLTTLVFLNKNFRLYLSSTPEQSNSYENVKKAANVELPLFGYLDEDHL